MFMFKMPASGSKDKRKGEWGGETVTLNHYKQSNGDKNCSSRVQSYPGHVWDRTFSVSMLQRKDLHKNFLEEFCSCSLPTLIHDPEALLSSWIRESGMISIHPTKQFKCRNWQLPEEETPNSFTVLCKARKTRQTRKTQPPVQGNPSL